MDNGMDIEKIKILREKLRMLERESGGVFEGREDCCGLTTAQCHTLLEIGSKGDISLVDLAAALGLDASTLSRTIQGLFTLGLVDRRTNAKDRRYVDISLTTQGRRVFEEIENRYNDYFSRVIEFLPADRLEAILENIGLFADAVRRQNERTGCCPPAGKS